MRTKRTLLGAVATTALIGGAALLVENEPAQAAQATSRPRCPSLGGRAPAGAAVEQVRFRATRTLREARFDNYEHSPHMVAKSRTCHAGREWRAGRVVEGSAFEMRRAGNRAGGSNPSLSARTCIEAIRTPM